ncbi:MAG: IS4 family transposase [bacterium]
MKKKDAQISAKLSEIPIEEISNLTGFIIRDTAIIRAMPFVMGFFKMILHGINTVEHWAGQICKLCGHEISAQALQGKLQFRHQRFAEVLLTYVLRHQIMQSTPLPISTELFKAFGRAFLEDSTCVKLPSVLAEFFPGNYNHKDKDKGATARVQLRLELKSGEYTHLALQGFRDNDQKFSSDIVLTLRPGDLVLRDMGYCVLWVFRLIMQQEAFFVSRFRYATNVYDADSGKQIDLHKKLRSLRHQGGNVLDTPVLIGQKEKLPVRLVAIKAPPQVEQQRKRKAEKDRNKKTNHSQEYMELLGWTIFITNVPTEVFTPEQLLLAYGFRWRIEIVFKCWKSKFDFAHLFDKKQSMTPARAVISFYLLLIWLTLFFSKWYNFFLLAVFKAKQKWLSLFKFADFVKEHFEDLLLGSNLNEFVSFLARYCTYGKRKQISNFMEKLYLLKLA